MKNTGIVLKKNNKTIGRLVAVGFAGAAFFIAMGWPFFHFIAYAGKKKSKGRKKSSKKWFSLKHTKINHPKHGFLEEYEASRAWCEVQLYHEWYIKSRDGFQLHASYLPAEKPERIVVMCHGYKGTRFGSAGHMAKFLHENNCSLLMIDQRCCGESEGKYITFGAKEQYDIIDWLRRLEEENVSKLPVYLYGQSMGAASVILASGHISGCTGLKRNTKCRERISRGEEEYTEDVSSLGNNEETGVYGNVKGVIADCGYHSMKQQLRDIASGWFHLHWIELLLMRVDLFCRIFAGFSMKETDTTKALKNSRLPMLFFHGEEDTYVFPENSRRNYKLCASEKELVMIPGARHLCCSYADPELYARKLMSFFRKNES